MNPKNTQPKHPTILHFFTVLFNTEFFLSESLYWPTSPLMSLVYIQPFSLLHVIIIFLTVPLVEHAQFGDVYRIIEQIRAW